MILHGSPQRIQPQPLVRRFKDGSLHFTDAAVLDRRERVRAAHEAAWRTRRKVAVERARVMRREMGLDTDFPI